MVPTLYIHPFSSYSQKAKIAFYEREAPFTPRQVEPGDPTSDAELAALSPLSKFPVLVDGDRIVLEATAIIEHLDAVHVGSAPLIPRDPAAAVETRMMDRLFDNYVMGPTQTIVGDRLRPEDARDPYGVEQARATLVRMYGWMDRRLADREWAAGATFSLADCAAAPALFYADWVEPISDAHTHLLTYAHRLMARPSVARAIDEARYFRPHFPLGGAPRW